MLEYIESAKSEIASIRSNQMIICKNMSNIEDTIYRKYIFAGIENDLASYNYSELHERYLEYFNSIKIPTITILKGRLFYRGRIGCIIIHGSIDDCNEIFNIPYYGKSISAAPPLYVAGGRFNRDGVSYLYLATDIETCLAETHVEVGQHCVV